MKLYFENAVTTVTTLMILALLGYIGWSAANRAAIQHWGCRSLFLLAFGLAVCCCAAARSLCRRPARCADSGKFSISRPRRTRSGAA